MIVLKPAQKYVLSLLGDQKPLNTRYIPSKFNHLYLHENRIPMVSNTFTGIIAILTPEQYEILKKPTESSSVGNAFSDSVIELIRARFLVPEGRNEVEDYFSFYDIVMQFYNSSVVNSFTVSTTTGCNARCFYCFEHDFKTQTMTKYTAQVLAQYMVENAKGKPVEILWFGGEPLCNTAVIDSISSYLTEAGITFGSKIVTNGYAFTKDMIATAKNAWNVENVQITLDGLRDEHNKRKAFLGNDPDPFSKIIQNIHDLLNEGITVSFLLNYDKDNISQMEPLIDFLADEFLGQAVSIYFSILYEDTINWHSGRTTDDQLFLVNEKNRLNLYAHEKGLAVAAPYYMHGSFTPCHCRANSQHHRFVNPDGSFAVCQNYGTEKTYGSVFDGITDMDTFLRWTQNTREKVRDQCRECKFLPECTSYPLCAIKNSFCYEEHELYRNLEMIQLFDRWKSQRDKE